MKWIFMIWLVGQPSSWHVFDSEVGCNNAVAAFHQAYWQSNRGKETENHPVAFCFDQSPTVTQEHDHQ